MAAQKKARDNCPNLQTDLENLMGNVEVCRSVGLEIINNTKTVTLEDFRSYCFSGKIQTVLPFDIGPHSVGRCVFAKTPYSLRGSVGVLVCKASSFSLAIMFSNPFDYMLYNIEFALQLFKSENHMGNLNAVFSRMMESKPYSSSTLFQRAKLQSEHETLEVSLENIRVRAKMSNSEKAILKVQVKPVPTCKEQSEKPPCGFW
ncbi:uncharacterized protein LOC121062585 [Cygnus olor]|uniref:uncharacterized protein LOC121062585 n=1 Tax=Cygnus olor TaxID=8869 RepID=UPI001ADE6BDB|nr:uncharacterized protein LOC121062585 [Cygnus olor]